MGTKHTAIFVLVFVGLLFLILVVANRTMMSDLSTPSVNENKSADPTVQVIAFSFDEAGYEEAWIQFIDEKERLVQVQAVDSRIVIVFRLKKKEDLARYPKGHITPITPLCRGGRTDCDIGSQQKLYVGSVEVQPVKWKTYGANRKLKIQKR